MSLYFKDPTTGEWVKQAGGGGGGSPGKSAYEYAVEAGYTGTEEEFAEKLAKNYSQVSVQDYGAKGDGSTDDTTAFQNALAENRVVFVPGGTYKLSGTLVIRPNCALELSQDTVLQFTQTSGNCIEVGCSATLKANHAIISAPYAFTGHVVDIDTTGETERETPPYTHWDPMWKSGRYIYDVCLVKANSSGLHYSTDGNCSGTAIYVSANSKAALGYIWGAMLHGIRIAGAFTYGIHVINYDDTAEDDGWNHDMRIEAVIQGCETGVSMTNCNNAHLAVAIQPSTAENGTKYAKWGVYLNDCKNIDMSSANIWDWQVARTDSKEYSYVAMYGSCPGLILSDMRYNQSAVDVRDQIYTDTPSNLESMVILQEPATRWFKPVDGVPYFNNGNADKRLMVEDDLQEYFNTNRVSNFSDALATAINTDGSIYNGVGYKEGIVVGNTGAESSLAYYVSTGYIACKAGDVLHMQGISFDTPVPLEDGSCKVVYYDANFNRIFHATCMNIMGGSQYYQAGERTADGMKFTIKPTLSEQGTVAYVRFTFHIYDFGDSPIISVNDEIKYVVEGFLADSVKVKGNNMYLYSPSGKTFKLSINDNGELTTQLVSV